jgi:type VI secretion system secreted protein VgrG
VLQAGQSSITLEGSNITFACPGNFTVKGGSHNLAAGASAPASLAALPAGTIGATALELLAKSPYDEQFRAMDKVSGRPVVGLPYQILFPDGSTTEGVTDEDGKTQRVKTLDSAKLKIIWGAPRNDAMTSSSEQLEGC